MEKTKSNILAIGSSGTGKSTLINAVFDCGVATTGSFGGGKTQTLMIYNNDELNYTIIDTKGLELGFKAQRETLRQVSAYIKDIIKEGNAEAAIDVIWYCVDSQGKRIYDENVKQILDVYKIFPNVPVIFVLTKAYGAEGERNKKEVREAIEKYDKKRKINISGIIAVNSAPFCPATGNVVPITGIKDLINATNEILPDAKKTSELNMQSGKKKMKNRHANLTLSACTSAAVAVGVAPIPVADSVVLTSIQTGMIKGITKLYDVDSSVIATAIFDGTVATGVAKTALSTLKLIPGLNIAAAVLNGLVAGVVTAAIGETAILVCKKIDSGEISVNDTEGIKKIILEKGSSELEKLLSQVKESLSKKDTSKLDEDGIKNIVLSLLKKNKQ